MARCAVALSAAREREAAAPERDSGQHQNGRRHEPCLVAREAGEDEAPARLRARSGFAAIRARATGASRPVRISTSTHRRRG